MSDFAHLTEYFTSGLKWDQGPKATTGNTPAVRWLSEASSGLGSPKNLPGRESCIVYIESRLNKDFNVFADIDIIIKLC